MAANALEFNQVATILNAIQNQVTGRQNIAPVDGTTFATAADTVLKTGYEQVYNAISMVLGRTIFSIRPYDRKFKGLEMSDAEFKMHTRKLQIADSVFEDNQTMEWPVHYDATHTGNPFGDGESVDQQKIKKSEIIQTNFYGMNTYQDHYTIFDEQLDVAFSSPEELGRFFSMITMNISNMFEQARENWARYTLVNFMGSLYDIGGERVVHLLTEYNALLGLSGADALDANSVYLPENFPSFIKWFSARMKKVSRDFTERSIKFQSPIKGRYITRHTPVSKQRIFIYAPVQDQIETMVLSSVFHDTYLKRAYTEEVNFWQNINSPDTVNVYPCYQGTEGSPVKGDLVNTNKIFGCLMDEEACGYTLVKSTMKAAPYNAAADYQNFFLKDYHKNYNDVSEKAVLLVLD